MARAYTVGYATLCPPTDRVRAPIKPSHQVPVMYVLGFEPRKETIDTNRVHSAVQQTLIQVTVYRINILACLTCRRSGLWTKHGTRVCLQHCQCSSSIGHWDQWHGL